MKKSIRNSPSGPVAAGGPPPLYFGANNGGAGEFLIPFDTGLVAPTGNIAVAQIMMPYDCRLEGLIVKPTTGLSVGNPIFFALLVNGVDSDILATLNAGDTIATDDDHFVNVLRGDLVAIRMDTGGASVAGLLAAINVL